MSRGARCDECGTPQPYEPPSPPSRHTIAVVVATLVSLTSLVIAAISSAERWPDYAGWGQWAAACCIFTAWLILRKP